VNRNLIGVVWGIFCGVLKGNSKHVVEGNDVTTEAKSINSTSEEILNNLKVYVSDAKLKESI